MPRTARLSASVGIKPGIFACSPRPMRKSARPNQGYGSLRRWRNREHMWEGELTRIKGELMRVQGRSASEIETCLARAMAISRAQAAKSLELRAARSLARLWRDRGRPSAARALLAPLLTWLTEGFQTA